jgi:hypothetical protein
MRRTLLAGIAGILALGAVALAGSADAQGKGKKKGSGPVVLEEIVIEGRVQKPQAFYILQRSNFGFQVMELKTEYIDDIKESVKDEAF